MASHQHTTASFSGTCVPNRRFSLLKWLFGIDRVHRQRLALRDMTDAQLSDIGVTREEAMREAARPVWDAPSQMRRPF